MSASARQIRAVGRVLQADSESLTLEVPGWTSHRPGQFAMLSFNPDSDRFDPLLPRPMAVYRGDASGLEFRFKCVGRGTELMGRLPVGTRMGVVGPLGNGFPLPEGRPVLVGGGTGIASLYELAQACGSSVRVLLGGRSEADILGLEDFRALPVELEVATEDGSLGHRGLVTDLLKVAPDDEVFACGPSGMMERAHELVRAGGARCWVSLEAHMACGFGVCLGCAIRTSVGFRYVCTHGPVFDSESVDWATLP